MNRALLFLAGKLIDALEGYMRNSVSPDWLIDLRGTLCDKRGPLRRRLNRPVPKWAWARSPLGVRVSRSARALEGLRLVPRQAAGTEIRENLHIGSVVVHREDENIAEWSGKCWTECCRLLEMRKRKVGGMVLWVAGCEERPTQ